MLRALASAALPSAVWVCEVCGGRIVYVAAAVGLLCETLTVATVQEAFARAGCNNTTVRNILGSQFTNDENSVRAGVTSYMSALCTQCAPRLSLVGDPRGT